jgi:hypothetical protein
MNVLKIDAIKHVERNVIGSVRISFEDVLSSTTTSFSRLEIPKIGIPDGNLNVECCIRLDLVNR